GAADGRAASSTSSHIPPAALRMGTQPLIPQPLPAYRRFEMASICPMRSPTVGLTAHTRRATPLARARFGRDPFGMLKNPIIVCLALAAIVVLAAVAEAVVVLTTRRRRIAW